MTKLFDERDFDLLSGWSRTDAKEMLLHFKVTMERLCDRLDRLRVFRNAHRARGAKEETFWHLGSPQVDEGGNLVAYQYYQPARRHFYIRNHGGAGEIQFNVGFFGDRDDDIARSARVAMGFSFGGRFIADIGSLGTVKTPWFFRGFKEVLRQDAALRAQMEQAIRTCGLIFHADRSVAEPAAMLDRLLALDEEALPGSEMTWVALERFVRWSDSPADLMDMDRFVESHCRPVFEGCYPVWEAVQKHTRRHYGSVI